MSSPANIALNAHLLSGEASYRSAGIHGYLYNTLAQLPETSPEFKYTVMVGGGTLPSYQHWDVQRSRLPTHNPIVRIMWEQLIAPVALRQIRPNLFHGMGFSLPLMWQGPSVVTIYDLSFLRFPTRLGRARRLYLEHITLISARHACRVIAISQSGKAEIETLLNISAAKIDVALPGVAGHFQPLGVRQVADFRMHYKLPGRFILYVGTIEPRKNLETLLRAYADLPQRGQVGLVLVGGKGWDTEATFAIIEQLGLRDQVVLPGYVSAEALPMWYNAAEVFAYPSVYEGFGLPLIEAMACGLPVIASATSSLPEAVGQDGILVPAMSVEAWRDALASLLDSSEQRAELSVRGKARAKPFTWENTARQTVESYRLALNRL